MTPLARCKGRCWLSGALTETVASTRRAGGGEGNEEEEVGAGGPFGELAEEGQAGVDVDALAVARVNERAGLLRVAGIIHGQQGRVFAVELRPQIQAALLHPAIKIRFGDFVGAIEKRVAGLEKFHQRVFVGDAWQWPWGWSGSFSCRGSGRRDQRWIGRIPRFVPGEIALILHEKRAAFGGVVKKALVRG